MLTRPVSSRTSALLRLALRDLRHQRAFAIFFVVNLALGLSGALLLDSLQGSVGRTLETRSRTMLGADVRVSSTRALRAEEVAALDGAASARATSDLVQLYSMISGGQSARLAELRGIDGHFPLRGAVVLSEGGVVDDAARARLQTQSEAWADPALLDQLGVRVGDSVRVGGGEFRIADTLARDTGLSVRAASLAPRLYVSLARLGATGLLEKGSRVEHQHLVTLADDADADAVALAMSRVVEDPRVRVTSHGGAVTEISGAYTRVTRYLGLVSLVALALAAVASAYLFHAFERRRLPDLAILMSLGARRRRAQAWMLLEVSMLATAAAVVAVALVTLSLPVVAWLIGDLLPAELVLDVSLGEAASALGVALIVGPVSCLPLLAGIARLRAGELFQDKARLGLARGPRDVLWAVPAALVFLGLSAWRVGDLRQGAWFAGAMLAALAVTALAGRVLLPALVAAGSRARVTVRLALRALSPRRRGSRTAFTALTLTALLLGLPPQLRALFLQQLEGPDAEEIPSLFLFDIQPEQAGPLGEHLAAAGTAWQRLAPMIRARMVAINDQAVGSERKVAVSSTAELRESARLSSRHYNLTYQDALHSTETLVAGRPFSGAWDEASGALPEISMEVDFARRLGLELGDRLRFDVQGVPVDGRIVNMRSVDWTSLQPNFFVSFQPGVLEAAPSVFLASVPALDAIAREGLQVSLVEAFPNVSMIDVTRGVERALGLLRQLRWAVAATAWTALAVGLLLVFAIARDEADERRWDLNLMKVLGARPSLLRTSVTVEFAALAAVAAALGCAVGAGVCAALASAVLDVAWTPAWAPLAAVLVVLPLLAALTARTAMGGVLRQRPQLSLG